jgi:hypothetical protein
LTHANEYHRTGKTPEKTFGIPCRSVSEIAEADSTSVFSGVFPVLLEYAVLWVKFRPRGQGSAVFPLLSLALLKNGLLAIFEL